MYPREITPHITDRFTGTIWEKVAPRCIWKFCCRGAGWAHCQKHHCLIRDVAKDKPKHSLVWIYPTFWANRNFLLWKLKMNNRGAFKGQKMICGVFYTQVVLLQVHSLSSFRPLDNCYNVMRKLIIITIWILSLKPPVSRMSFSFHQTISPLIELKK